MNPKIEGISYDQAQKQVQSWEGPLFERLVEPGLKVLSSVEPRETTTAKPIAEWCWQENN